MHYYWFIGRISILRLDNNDTTSFLALGKVHKASGAHTLPHRRTQPWRISLTCSWCSEVVSTCSQFLIALISSLPPPPLHYPSSLLLLFSDLLPLCAHCWIVYAKWRHVLRATRWARSRSSATATGVRRLRGRFITSTLAMSAITSLGVSACGFLIRLKNVGDHLPWYTFPPQALMGDNFSRTASLSRFTFCWSWSPLWRPYLYYYLFKPPIFSLLVWKSSAAPILNSCPPADHFWWVSLARRGYERSEVWWTDIVKINRAIFMVNFAPLHTQRQWRQL